jgi:cobalt-zinc-cadmium efflux system membrane fusion protein
MKRAPLLVFSFVLASCGGTKPSAEPASSTPAVQGDVVVFHEDAPQVSSFAVAPAARAGADKLAVTGRLVWDEDATVRVFPPVGGRVTKILVDVGTRVREGEVLARLASPDFGQAQADAVRAAADLASAERTLDRVRQLFEKGAAPRKDVDEAEATQRRARAEAERTRARLASWSGGTGGEAVDQDFRLRSPVSGVVVERALNPGQEVRPDAQVPLLVVSNPSRLWVLLDVGEHDVDALKPGVSLSIRTPAYPDRVFPGTLRVVGASLDPSTRTVHARGVVDNREGLLKAEMYVSVDLVRRSSSNEVVLPARAVVSEGAEHVVFVEEKRGRYRRLPVGTGRERDGLVPVTGLAPDARVVVQGTILLEAAWASARGAA